MTAAKATIVHAHPYPRRSRAGRALLDAVRDLPSVEIRSLYALYPDFAIDVASEQAALLASDLVVWQAPFYWYGAPAMLHLWFEKVLARGFAYGPGGEALRGKRALWVATTGAPRDAYRADALHGHPFDAFVPAFQQTASFCGMRWEAPVVLHGGHHAAPDDLAAARHRYRAYLTGLCGGDDARG